MRTMVYVDGFNMYYGCLRKTPYKWLDLCALFDRTIPPNHTLAKVKYFTARVSSLPNDPDAPLRQNVYLRALEAHCGKRIEIIEGRFQVKNKWAPLAKPPNQVVEVINTEEKGSDVNLAVELVHDAWNNLFDCAVVVSNDADLERALKIAKQIKKKRLILMTPGGPVRKPLTSLTRWAHKQKNIDSADLAASQLPLAIPGTTLTKPSNW